MEYRYFNLFLIVVFSCLGLTNFAQEKKPDLIFVSVSSTIVRYKPELAPYQPVRGCSYKSYIEYKIVIKNIGSADFSNAFFVS
jgi:hypothetical protein